VGDAPLLVVAGPGGAEAGILDLRHDLLADAAENEEARGAGVGAVEAEGCGAEAGLERGHVDEAGRDAVGAWRRQFEKDAAAAASDMDGKEARLALCVREDIGGRFGLGDGRERKRGGGEQEEQEELHRGTPFSGRSVGGGPSPVEVAFGGASG